MNVVETIGRRELARCHDEQRFKKIRTEMDEYTLSEDERETPYEIAIGYYVDYLEHAFPLSTKSEEQRTSEGGKIVEYYIRLFEDVNPLIRIMRTQDVSARNKMAKEECLAVRSIRSRIGEYMKLSELADFHKDLEALLLLFDALEAFYWKLYAGRSPELGDYYNDPNASQENLARE